MDIKIKILYIENFKKFFEIFLSGEIRQHYIKDLQRISQ